MDYLEESGRLSSLYSEGVARLRGAHNLAVALDNVRDVLGEDETEVSPEAREKRLQREKELEDLAKDEVASGFRLLSAHAILGAWGVFESAVDDWVVDWISRRPQDLSLDDATEIKLPAMAYVIQSARDRAEILFTALRKRQGQSFGAGINRFERPLATVGLSAAVPEFLSDALFELHKVRNVYAHSGGRADEQFVSDCPWFGLRVGDIVPVSNRSFNGYTCLLEIYLLLLLHRGYARVGIRLEGSDYRQYWDPAISVASASREQEDRYCASLPPCADAVAVIRERHSDLLAEAGPGGE
jgi:hypothetical protein